jgi:hypothetical protein
MRRFIVAWAISTIALLWPVCVFAEVQDNDLVAHKIHDVLKRSGRMSGSSFVIKCQDGTAWLEGRVSTEEQKALALRLTGEVPEITDVVDHLRVEPKSAASSAARVPAMPSEELQAEAAAEESLAADESEEAEAPQERSPVMSWLSRPSVKAASAPGPQARGMVSAKSKQSVTSHQDGAINDDASVYPEELESSENVQSKNPLVRQVANLKTVFRRQTHSAPRPLASENAQVEPRTMPRHSSQCAKCNAAAARKTTTHSHPATAQNQPTEAGRVRMVPMMELPDGRLVPVAQRVPLGQPIAGQQASSQSRARVVSNKKTRTNMARRQEVIEGPVDVEAAPPMPVGNGGPLPAYVPGVATGVAPAYYDQPHMPNYAWPSYAAHPNYAGVTYPRQYSPTAWPYIGPFYPYPQVPLGWRKVTLEWDDGWWFLDFDDCNRSYAY